MTKLEQLLLQDLSEATRFLAAALYGQFDEPRRGQAKAFLLRAHDSEESIAAWTLGLPVHEYVRAAVFDDGHCRWLSPDQRGCDHGPEHAVHNLSLAATVPAVGP